MTEWYEYGKWHNDQIPEKKKVKSPVSMVTHMKLSKQGNVWLWELFLDCGHSVFEVVPLTDSPKGRTRVCSVCSK